MSEISVQVDRFDAGQEYAALIAEDTDGGAAVFFVGRVRARSEGRQVTGLTVEHYPGMTEQALERIVQEARQRWPLQRVRVVHRVGALALGEPIVFVGALSAHRDRKSTRLNSSHVAISYAVVCLKKKTPICA